MAEQEKIKPTYAGPLQNRVACVLTDDEGQADYPTIFELMRPHIDDKGRYTRKPGKLTINVEGSCYRVVVSCPTEGLETVVVVSSLTDLMAKVEESVRSANQTWVPTYDARQRAGKDLDRLLQ